MLRGHWMEVESLNVVMPICCFQSQHWVSSLARGHFPYPCVDLCRYQVTDAENNSRQAYWSLIVNTGSWASFLMLGVLHETCLYIPLETLSPTTWMNSVQFWFNVSSRDILLTIFSIQPHDTYAEFPESMVHEGSRATSSVRAVVSPLFHSGTQKQVLPVSLSSAVDIMTLDSLPSYFFSL